MTAKEFYRNFLLQAQTIYPLSEATAITDWIFESTAKIKKADLIKSPNQLLSDAAINELTNHLTELLQHKPVQYILGEAWFYNMKLKVNENVLIPRPETEELVEWIISVAGRQSSVVNILDIGTGSGCIAIALKKQLPAITITAIDISNNALTLAKENANRQSVTIEFIENNFLDESNWKDFGMFDIIVSNPPYIPLNEKEKMNRNVTNYEPHSALFVPDDAPLLFYEKIAAFGRQHLNYEGRIFVEVHENYAEKIATLFRSAKYMYVDVKQDMYEKERMIMASY